MCICVYGFQDVIQALKDKGNIMEMKQESLTADKRGLESQLTDIKEAMVKEQIELQRYRVQIVYCQLLYYNFMFGIFTNDMQLKESMIKEQNELQRGVLYRKINSTFLQKFHDA